MSASRTETTAGADVRPAAGATGTDGAALRSAVPSSGGWTLAAVPFLALVLALYLWGLGGPGLKFPDETRYAQVAREMLETGRWTLPTFNRQPYYEKGPLYFWAVALLSLPAGDVTEWSARAPSALAAFGLVLCVWLYGRHRLGARAGLLSALVFASMLGLVAVARFTITDLAHSLLVTVALLALSEGVRGHRPWFFFFLAWIALGLGVLAKGPVTFGLPLAVILVWAAWDGRLRALIHPAHLPGILAAAALVGVYAACAERESPGYLRHVFERIWLRTSTEKIHPQPWYFYGYVVPACLAPWTFFLPAALAARGRSGTAEVEAEDRSTWRLAAAWAAVVMLFHSLPTTKGYFYLHPTLPALALLIGPVLAARPATGARQWWVRGAGLATAVVLAGVAAAPWLMTEAGLPGRPAGATAAYTVAAGLAAAVALAAALRDRTAHLAGSVAAAVAALVAYWVLVWAPALDERLTGRRSFEEFGRIVGPAAPLCLYDIDKPTFLFYLRRTGIPSLKRTEDLAHFFDRPERAFCVAGVEDYLLLCRRLGRPPYKAAEGGPLVYHFVLISNRPD